MSDFSREELVASHKAISSSIRKIEKVQITLLKKDPLPKSQLTLAERNLNALKLSITLINRELEQYE